MVAIIAGIAMTAAAIWFVVVLRRKGESHAVFRLPGADLLVPVVLLTLMVLGTAFIFTGAQQVW
ncbi:MAG: hypothetical protein ACK4UO_13920 [Pseudolabrys sp.]